ncbi:MAG: sugar-binding protein, partial [Calditrichaceae bacterium]
MNLAVICKIPLIFMFIGISYSQIQIPKTTTAPTIDGNLDAVWANAFIDSTRCMVIGNERPEKSDFSAEFRIMWDNDYLYIFVLVTDDTLYSNHAEAWNGDDLAIFIDGGNERNIEYDQNDVVFSWLYDINNMVAAYNFRDPNLFNQYDFPN